MSFESWMYVNMHGLLEAQLHQRSLPGGAQGPMNGHEKSLGSNGPSPLLVKKSRARFFTVFACVVLLYIPPYEVHL